MLRVLFLCDFGLLFETPKLHIFFKGLYRFYKNKKPSVNFKRLTHSL